MKRILAFLLAVIFIVGCVACADGGTPPATTPAGNQNTPENDNEDDINDNNETESNQIMLEMPNVRPRPKDPVGDIGSVPREIDALLTVARAYVARTNFTQYEDSKMTTSEYWFIKQKDKSVDPRRYAPELGTSQRTYYSSCAVLIKDIFLTAWGEELVNPVTLTSAQITQEKQYSFWRYDAPAGEETAAEKEKIKNEFLSILQPGDVIVTQKKGASGHILLYVGNGWAIHSTNYKDLGGGDYSQTNNSPKFEVNGAVEYYNITKFFGKGEKYDFWAYAAWSIIRPTTYMKNIQITEQTKARMENLVNIYAEKISSHPIGTTAQIGENITYGIYLRNDRDEKATVELKDIVPENTTYVSGAQKIDGNNMSWSVELAPGEEKMVCYTVKVNEDQSLYNFGVIVSNEATAGGVNLPCNNIYIAKMPDDEMRGKIERAAEKLLESDRREAALAKAIYQKAGLELDIPGASELVSSLFVYSSSVYTLNTNSPYYKMIVPTLYGGNKSKGNDAQKGDRNQFFDYVLVAGDILVCKEGSTFRMYMCVGENKIIDLNASKLTIYEGEQYKKVVYSVYGQDAYAVLRPSSN